MKKSLWQNIRKAHSINNLYKPRKPRNYVRWSCAAGVASWTLYDGLKHDFLYSEAAFRFLRSIQTAAIIACDYAWLFQWHKETEPNYVQLLEVIHKRSAERLLHTCMQNGGLYIKVGQGVAAINHILPAEYINTLAQLQDQCLHTTQQDVRKVFLQDFGNLPEEIFEKFDYKPVAAASLAQVFKAQLHSGQNVAVKVQYGDLQKRFKSDLGTIIFLQHLIEFCFKSYNFGWILHDLRENLISELNFVNEAKNAERCASDFCKFSFVHVPTIYWKFTDTRVLTMEWIDGCKISDTESIRNLNLDLRDIDIKLFRVFAEQIFNTGFIHADPHPGNIFVRKNNRTKKAELVILDHGLYEQLPAKFRLPLCEFWEATVLRDENKMRTSAHYLNIKDYMKFAEILFQQPIRLQEGRIKTKLSQSDIEYMQEIAKKNFEQIMSALREMPRNMLFVVRNLNTIRAIGHQHGDIVDRPRVMAKHAQYCIYTQRKSMLGYIRWLYRRMLFEYYFWRSNFTLTCIQLYFRLLYKLGRAPEAANTILDDLTKQSLQ